MPALINDEINALQRMLYLLEEHSIGHLAKNDSSFRNKAQDIYSTVERHLMDLERQDGSRAPGQQVA